MKLLLNYSDKAEYLGVVVNQSKTAVLSSICLAALIGCGGNDQSEDVVTAANLESEPIINGTLATEPLIDRQGALYVSSSVGRYIFICGATYIGVNSDGEHWVLTAAHCVENTQGNYLVAFGKSRRSDYLLDDTVAVNEIVIPSGYNFGVVSKFDIALLRVSGQPNATAVTLASSETDAASGEEVVISGFGATLFGSSDVLLRADTRVLDTLTCSRFFSSLVDGSQICILDDVGTAQNACSGDSGGPMFRRDATQVGITSFGRSNCPTDAPSVYTRVAAFRDWIESVSGI